MVSEGYFVRWAQGLSWKVPPLGTVSAEASPSAWSRGRTRSRTRTRSGARALWPCVASGRIEKKGGAQHG